MAINEACQVWIEQRIKEELPTGKSYRAIGREIAQEIAKVFEAQVNPRTLEKRAERTATFVAPQPTTKPSNAIRENQVLETETVSDLPSHGGKRKGSGRPPKYSPPENDPLAAVIPIHSDAMNFSWIAISQLKRIRPDDPRREEAFDEVENWIHENRRK